MRIQGISLPRHHQDKPEDLPKCKGFALVTFRDTNDVEMLLAEWPWRKAGHVPNPIKSRAEPATDTSVSSAMQQHEAQKFGFRVTTKSQWEHLNQEYLTYRLQLLDELAREEAETLQPPTRIQAEPPAVPVAPQPARAREPLKPSLDASAPYPTGCLVFIRHVHPETNKTTLRKLFSHALEAADSIDYVDFNKGMDTVRTHPLRLLRYRD